MEITETVTYRKCDIPACGKRAESRPCDACTCDICTDHVWRCVLDIHFFNGKGADSDTSIHDTLTLCMPCFSHLIKDTTPAGSDLRKTIIDTIQSSKMRSSHDMEEQG